MNSGVKFVGGYHQGYRCDLVLGFNVLYSTF
jgi:hypothetical protein